MTWKRIEIAEAEKAAWKRAFGQAARFLVDEGIDPELARALSNLGYKSTSVKAAGLEGRSDEDVLAFAKREDRIQWQTTEALQMGAAFQNTGIQVSSSFPPVRSTTRGS
jgi:hypothetical protein